VKNRYNYWNIIIEINICFVMKNGSWKSYTKLKYYKSKKIYVWCMNVSKIKLMYHDTWYIDTWCYISVSHIQGIMEGLSIRKTIIDNLSLYSTIAFRNPSYLSYTRHCERQPEQRFSSPCKDDAGASRLSNRYCWKTFVRRKCRWGVRRFIII